MNFREKENLLQYIFLRYKVTKPSYIQECEAYYCDEIKKLVENTIKLLDKEEKRIIEKDFIENENNWWNDYYSRATYYRLKKACMKKFIRLINGQ